MSNDDNDIEPIAVVGMSVRVPGARTPAQYWNNICNKVESVTWFEQDELLAAGVPRGLCCDPAYVRAACALPEADLFDAEFFGISRTEAAMLDPQHRLFLECAWEALEDSGHDPQRFDGSIGVYGGCFMNRYLINLYTNQALMRTPMAYFARNYNDKDFLTGHVAYLLNLRGPAITVQTACSTSLVATHLACQALLAHDCDLALAGGVSVTVPLKAGYLAMEGTMYSPDGKCRPFDAAARGTLPGSGGVLVVLKRLSDALAAGDHIRAVIRGTAINNDGRNKVSFTAPSPQGQMQVIVAAQSVAGVHPDTIGYVETHGTGTVLGDPIEIAALTDAFRYQSSARNFCALGSVKANIGHLDAGAGAAGLARAVLSLEHKCIPAMTNFSTPNPELRLETSPFYVPTQTRAWPAARQPRRAAVSSFAVGGTNAHAILEEAPARSSVAARRKSHHLLVLSARDDNALNAMAHQLADELEQAPNKSLHDIGFTLAVGRAEFAARRIVVGADSAATASALRSSTNCTKAVSGRTPQVVFMFPGVGTQYPDMAADIYDAEPVFRNHVDRCAALVHQGFGIDVREYLFNSRHPAAQLDRESVPNVLPAIFTVEYALAQLWMSWGVQPAAMLGHSLGEYVAACLAGVLSLPDALNLTVRRGQLFENIPDGRMMGVPLSEAELMPLLGERLSLGAVNAPGLCLASGMQSDLQALSSTLQQQRGLQCRLLPVRMASHSHLVEPYLSDFIDTVGEYTLSQPNIPYVSCVTGTWIEAARATDPKYWAQQLRSPVQFAKMLRTVLATPDRVLLEVGPGTTLTQLARAQQLPARPVAITSLRHPQDSKTDYESLLTALGSLWQEGVTPDWQATLGEGARRVPLPTYALQRKRYWVEQQIAIGPGAWNQDGSQDQVPTAPTPVVTSIARTQCALPCAAASGTKLQQAIAAVWSMHLGTDEIGLDDPFEVLGGHSLLAAQMLPQLRALTNKTLMVADLFGAPTVRALAEFMESALAVSVAVAPPVDLAAEVVLDPSIQASDALAPLRGGEARAVLLTGGTGFVGTYILSELLQQTTATVYCLVRADTVAEGERRLCQALQKFHLSLPEPGRLVAVLGDLQQPQLGISAVAYERLAVTLDAIYHCGAWVNFARPYQVIKAANVGGTAEVLRLATCRQLKKVHLVSTLFVTMGSITTGVPYIGEEDPLPPPVGHDTAYTESKWVAEGLCRIAAARGVPVAVFRPGNILGDQRTGVANVEDFFTKAIQGCVQLGLIPRRKWALPVGTVDDVAKMVVKLSKRSDVIGRTFHLVHPEMLEWETIFAHVRRLGYDLPVVTWDEWRAQFARQFAAGHNNALTPLADRIADAPADRIWPRFGVENTARLRAETGEPYPLFDEQYFRTLLRHFADVGLLPPAQRQLRVATK